MIRYWAAGKGMADEQRVGQLTGLLVGDSDDLRANFAPAGLKLIMCLRMFRCGCRHAFIN